MGCYEYLEKRQKLIFMPFYVLYKIAFKICFRYYNIEKTKTFKIYWNIKNCVSTKDGLNFKPYKLFEQPPL